VQSEPNASASKLQDGSPQFTTTLWTVVLEAGSGDSADANNAMEQLCRRYWYPLYAFVRRSGKSSHDAQDLTQDFFAHLLQNNTISSASRERGRFRSFLLASLKNFLINDYRLQTRIKRGGGETIYSLDETDAEGRYLAEPVDDATPETLYEQRWALAILTNSLARLREDYFAHGRGSLFDLLKDFVWGERNGTSYAEIAAQLDLTEEAVKKAVQRLRIRFRETLQMEIAHTVATPAEVEEEWQHLLGLLRR
jgi:RNA polymerase sigma factor (sigma-70 family)